MAPVASPASPYEAALAPDPRNDTLQVWVGDGLVPRADAKVSAGRRKGTPTDRFQRLPIA